MAKVKPIQASSAPMSSCSANPAVRVTHVTASAALPSVVYDPFLNSLEGMKIFSTSRLICLPLGLQEESFQKYSQELTPD